MGDDFDNPSAEHNPDDPLRSTHTMVSSNDGSTIAGTAYLQGKQRDIAAKLERSSGQIGLYDEQSGQMGAMSYGVHRRRRHAGDRGERYEVHHETATVMTAVQNRHSLHLWH